MYNFQELREELAARGYLFRTRSDTEAIVHAYEEWGPDASSGFGECIRLIIDYLRVASNNSSASIGGGGTPLQALTPPFQ